MTQTKERALQALLTEKDKKSAAAAAGITYRTLMNYFNDDDFIKAYNAAFGVVINNATRTAQSSMGAALNVLREVAENPNEAGAARVAASKTILEYGLKLTEFNDVIKFIEETVNVL